MTLSVALAAAMLLSACAAPDKGTSRATQKAEVISGPAVALDGDTIRINGSNMDLWGVEAPNLDNSDGWYSRAALDDLIGENGALSCTIKTRTSRRIHAICTNNRVGDIGRAMLQGGWAVFARSDKRDDKLDRALAGVYTRAEARARRSRSGLWAIRPSR